MSRAVIAAIGVLLTATACSSGGQPAAEPIATASSIASGTASPAQGGETAAPSQNMDATPKPSAPRPEVPKGYLKSARSMSAKIVEGIDLVNDATGGMDPDNYSRADREKALRGFTLLVKAAETGAQAPLASISALDSAHNRVVSTLTDFASPGVEAFSTSDPIGEADYLVAVLSAEDFVSAFDAWTALLQNLIE